MGFFDALQDSPNNSSIYGSGRSSGGNNIGDILSFDAEMRRRNLNDQLRMKEASSGNALPSQRQPRMQRLFNPAGANPNGTPIGDDGKPMDLVFKDNYPDRNNRITPFQQAGLDIRKDDNSIDRAKLGLSAKLGEEKLDLAGKTHELNVEKNKNIYETKQADMQRKADEAERKAQLAEQTLASKQGDSKATLEFKQAQLDAVEARHALERLQKETEFKEAQRMHDETIKNNKTKTEQDKNVIKTEERDESGNKKTTTTQKGRIKVIGPNGQKGTIDAGDTLPSGWTKQ